MRWLSDLLSPLTPDVQARPPRDRASASRGSASRGVEKVIRAHHRRNGEPSSTTSPSSSASSTSTPAGGRAHVALRGGRRTRRSTQVVLGETLPRRGARRAHRRARCASARRACAPRSRSRARYPETVPTPVAGMPDAGDLHAVRHRRRLRAQGTRTLTGVEAQGMTACPCAQELVAGRARERLVDAGLHRRRDRARLRGRAGRHPQPARHRHALHRLPRGLPSRASTPATLLAHRRAVDELGDLRADEALGRASPSSRRRTAARGSSRTACAR